MGNSEFLDQGRKSSGTHVLWQRAKITEPNSVSSAVTDNMTVQKGFPKRQPMEKKNLSRDTRSRTTQERVIRISTVM